jgi:transcriptional regulator with XRE-family HTH domain
MVRGDSSFRDEVRPIDWHVGGRLRARRLALGMSQVRLAEALGSRLFDLAGVLRVPVDYFFADAPPEALYDVADRSADADHCPSHRETLDLVRVYYEIEDDGLRHKLIDLVKSVARSKS